MTPGGSSSPFLSFVIFWSYIILTRSSCSSRPSRISATSSSTSSPPETEISPHFESGIFSRTASVMRLPAARSIVSSSSAITFEELDLPISNAFILLAAVSRTFLSSASSSFLRRAVSASCGSASLSRSRPSREKTCAAMTVPTMPGETRSDVSLTSPAFSPKIALKSFSSGESCVSPLGVILPTKISPGFTSAPIRTMPPSSRFARASSETFGISRVMSSLPSLVSRAIHSNSSM